MVKMLVFVSFTNSTIRLRNLVYSSQTAWTDFRQSLKRLYFTLHMEVPDESKLFVLSGLDVNQVLFLWFFFLFSNHFDQSFGGGFGISRQSRQGWAMSAPHHSRVEVTTGLAKSW